MTNIESTKSVGDYSRLIRRRWQYPATIIPAGLMLAVLLAYTLPASYEASGVILRESPSLPTEMVPTTVTGREDAFIDATEQLELTRRRVMTDESLLGVVKTIDPYPEEPLGAAGKARELAQNTLVERVDPVTLEPSEISTAFAIRYSNPDPKIAADVAKHLVDLFLTYNQRTRAEQAEEALKFLQTQAHELETSMEGMEQRLAQFKARYGDALPDAQPRNIAGADRAERDLEGLQREIRLAQEHESMLVLQLNETSPSLTAAVGDWRTELAKVRAELAAAEQKYTPEHPDVKRLRRAVADLVAQGEAAGGSSGGNRQADNPEYLRIQSQLSAARRELEALRASASRARAQLSEYQQNLATTPSVERDYLRLAREYENAESRYQDLQSKIKEAALARTLESESRGERFTLLRAPYAPAAPASPNRLAILLLGFVLSAAIAMAAAVLVDASDPTVRSSDDLLAIGETSPIGAVPPIINNADRRHRQKLWGSVGAGYFAAAVLVAAIIVLVN